MTRPSLWLCASLAAWYSAFSDRSPCARASAIASMIRGRSSCWRQRSSSCRLTNPPCVIGTFSTISLSFIKHEAPPFGRRQRKRKRSPARKHRNRPKLRTFVIAETEARKPDISPPSTEANKPSATCRRRKPVASFAETALPQLRLRSYQNCSCRISRGSMAHGSCQGPPHQDMPERGAASGWPLERTAPARLSGGNGHTLPWGRTLCVQ
ncbi:hypothetical protein D9M72_533200 [compost metagenome]